MLNQTRNMHLHHLSINGVLKHSLLFGSLFFFSMAFAQENEQKKISEGSINASDNNLINQFIQSRGSSIITFDASNIKQFWIDNSVISRDDYFEIYVNEGKSIPLKIQLANVSGIQDCKVEVISETPNVDFTVFNIEKEISSSVQNDSFVNYNVISSVFHLEDTMINYKPFFNFCFQLKFQSKNTESIKIKAIILSFSNRDIVFPVSSGTVNLSIEDLIFDRSTSTKNVDTSFCVTGKTSKITTRKSFYIPDSEKEFNVSLNVKNTGETTTKVYVGYKIYIDKHIMVDAASYPYNNKGKILHVLSSEAGNNMIVVDSYSDWTKKSIIALNAKEDMSDVPTIDFLDGEIVDVIKNDDGSAQILLNKPLATALKKGESIRIHRPFGASIYSKIIDLQPGEEAVFLHKIKKDENYFQYSSVAFSRGVFYFKPIILSYSLDSKEDNTIQIRDYSVMY